MREVDHLPNITFECNYVEKNIKRVTVTVKTALKTATTDNRVAKVDNTRERNI